MATTQPSALTEAAAAGGAGAAVGYPDDEDYEPLPPVEQRRLDEAEQVGRKKFHGA